MLHWTLLLSELITGISSFLCCAKTLAQRRRCLSTGQITAALSMFAEVRDERQGQISLAYRILGIKQCLRTSRWSSVCFGSHPI